MLVNSPIKAITIGQENVEIKTNGRCVLIICKFIPELQGSDFLNGNVN